jgi:hypothetical protein
VCSECGAPWERITVRAVTGVDERRTGRSEPNGIMPNKVRAGDVEVETTGWRPACEHHFEVDGDDGATYSIGPLRPIPATVLDPFAGSGTTGMVANRLSRRAILIDLNGDYLKQQLQRNAQTPLGLGAA